MCIYFVILYKVMQTNDILNFREARLGWYEISSWDWIRLKSIHFKVANKYNF